MFLYAEEYEYEWIYLGEKIFSHVNNLKLWIPDLDLAPLKELDLQKISFWSIIRGVVV